MAPSPSLVHGLSRFQRLRQPHSLAEPFTVRPFSMLHSQKTNEFTRFFLRFVVERVPLRSPFASVTHHRTLPFLREVE